MSKTTAEQECAHVVKHGIRLLLLGIPPKLILFLSLSASVPPYIHTYYISILYYTYTIFTDIDCLFIWPICKILLLVAATEASTLKVS